MHSNVSWSGKWAKSWPISDGEEYFHILRVLNKGDPRHLCCSGIEFYGHTREIEPQGDSWVGNICTIDMKAAEGRGGFKIHPVLAVTGCNVNGKEELVPGFMDPWNHVNHSLDYH